MQADRRLARARPGHAAVAAWLEADHAVPGWWAQAVTVGWERITGRRLGNQMANGTFTANRSATVAIDRGALDSMLREPTQLEALLPGLDAVVRSGPTTKAVRVGLREGVAEFRLTGKGDGRTTVRISHAKLTSPEQIERWKEHWGAWLQALETVASQSPGARSSM